MAALRVRDRLILAACVVLYAALSVPGVFLAPRPGLDNSWIQVFNLAYERGWQFGTDVIVPYGPWNVLVIPLMAPNTFWLMIAFRAVLGGCMGWAVFAIARRARAPLWVAPIVVLLVAPLLAAPATIDPMCLAVPFVWLALGLFSRDDDAPAATAVFAVLAAAVALIKFTYFVVGLAVALLLSIDDVVIRRRFARRAATFVAVWIAGWLLGGQSLGHVPAWISTNLEGAGAYDEAMSTPLAPGDALEIGTYCVVALALLALAAVAFARQQRGVLRGALPLSGLALALFMNFKAGFVRHDVHALNATFVLPAVALAVWAACAESLPRMRALLAGGAVVAAAFGCSIVSMSRWTGAPSIWAYFGRFYAGAYGTLTILARPSELEQQLASLQEQSRAAIRAAVPLPDLPGSVDLYSYNQALLLARNGVDYRPRPVFQSYLAYSDALARRNAASLEHGPEHLLVDAATTDGRYPSTDDGRSWPVMLSRYDYVGTTGSFAHFARASEPRRFELEPQGETAVRCGERLIVPPHEGMLWAELDIDKTIVGSLLGLLLKAPPVRAHVTVARGGQADYRILPSIARGGLLLTPLVDSADDLARLATNRPFPPTKEVASLSFECSASYQPTIRARFFRLKITEEARTGDPSPG